MTQWEASGCPDSKARQPNGYFSPLNCGVLTRPFLAWQRHPTLILGIPSPSHYTGTAFAVSDRRADKPRNLPIERAARMGLILTVILVLSGTFAALALFFVLVVMIANKIR